jgi:hypothetical protein
MTQNIVSIKSVFYCKRLSIRIFNEIQEKLISDLPHIYSELAFLCQEGFRFACSQSNHNIKNENKIYIKHKIQVSGSSSEQAYFMEMATADDREFIVDRSTYRRTKYYLPPVCAHSYLTQRHYDIIMKRDKDQLPYMYFSEMWVYEQEQ